MIRKPISILNTPREEFSLIILPNRNLCRSWCVLFKVEGEILNSQLLRSRSDYKVRMRSLVVIYGQILFLFQMIMNGYGHISGVGLPKILPSPSMIRGGVIQNDHDNQMKNIPQQFLKGGNLEMRKKFQQLCFDAQVRAYHLFILYPFIRVPYVRH